MEYGTEERRKILSMNMSECPAIVKQNYKKINLSQEPSSNFKVNSPIFPRKEKDKEKEKMGEENSKNQSGRRTPALRKKR